MSAKIDSLKNLWIVGGAVDLRKLKKLIDLVVSSAISELEVTEGEEKVRIVKHSFSPPQQVVTLPVGVPEAMPVTPSDVPSEPREEGIIIRSPMVGTFYRSPAPGQAPFVSVGTAVQEGQVLCILEAMKLLNEIQSEQEGIIRSIFVEDGEPVEFNQPLFSLSLS